MAKRMKSAAPAAGGALVRAPVPAPRPPGEAVVLRMPGGRAAPSGPLRRPAHGAAHGVHLFQIFYDDWHKPLLDRDFEPFDNRGVSSELHEFAVFERIAASGQANGARCWGALSWRFGEKTGLSGRALRETIAANPDYDVYYCNPSPANEGLYHNVWVQGEGSHPSFLTVARAFLDAAGLPSRHLDILQPSEAFAACNYFIATPAFWGAYLTFVRRALGNAERKLTPRMRALLHSKVADPHGYHFGATYVPFIVERLFPLFLATDGAAFKAFKFPLPEREKQFNAHLRLLRQMRDLAHRSRSLWLTACWVNYRNLYLGQVNGREWCRKHLRQITPREIRFA